MSLEYWKREKNFRALEKGYLQDPEYFTFEFLLKRLKQETKELEQAIKDRAGIVSECADVSNIADYIATKALGDIPDHYHTKEVRG